MLDNYWNEVPYNPLYTQDFQSDDAKEKFLGRIPLYENKDDTPFTPDEEQIHFRALHFLKYKMQHTEGDEKEKWKKTFFRVRDRIVHANLKLLKKATCDGIQWKHVADEESLFSDASSTLLRCIELFDPWANFKFSTYFVNAFNRLLYRKPIRSVYMNDDDIRNVLSLNDLSEKSSTREESRCLDETVRAWRFNLSGLTDQEQFILKHRHGLDHCAEKTLKEIGDMLNICAERVRQIERRAHQKMRKTVENQIR